MISFADTWEPNMTRTTVAVALGLLITGMAFGQGTVGFELLRMEATARGAAASGALVAVSGEVDAMHSNPASIADLEDRWVSLTYLKHLLDFNSGTIGYAQSVRNYGTLGARITYFDYGSFDEATPQGEFTGRTFGANDILFSMSFARRIGSVYRIGVSVNYIRSQIEDYSASAVSTNIGFLVRTHAQVKGIQEVTIGAAVYNLGTATKAFIDDKDDLPMGFRGGFNAPLEYLPLTVSAQVTKWVDQDVQFALSGEFRPMDALRIRVGYSTEGHDQHLDTDKDTFAGFSTGFGIIHSKLRFDYALTSMGELGLINRFTISRMF